MDIQTEIDALEAYSKKGEITQHGKKRLVELKQNLLDQAKKAVTIKDATLNLKIKAKSGYSSNESHKISLDQWTRISQILNEK